jgi:hypothetical protein
MSQSLYKYYVEQFSLSELYLESNQEPCEYLAHTITTRRAAQPLTLVSKYKIIKFCTYVKTNYLKMRVETKMCISTYLRKWTMSNIIFM